MRKRKYTLYMADFETTVYEEQERTDVWAAALVKLYTDDVVVYGDIDSFFDAVFELPGHVAVYFHNLKFDGAFILNWLLHNEEWKQAYRHTEGLADGDFIKPDEMENNTYRYSIGEMGQWYSITLKHKGRLIEFRDSLKLLPFSVSAIGGSFQTMHKKSSIEYTGFRYPGCTITDEEKDYIKNDVLVVKEALEILMGEGHTKLTIGSCCLSEFKAGWYYKVYKELFPNLYKVDLPGISGAKNQGEYVKKSYRGGWCYIVPEKSGKIYKNGCSVDVNSLYPSMMHEDSGNTYPVGIGEYLYKPTDKDIEQLEKDGLYYFIRFKSRFYIKPGKLPFIQIKNTKGYPSRKHLITSDIWDKQNKCYSRTAIDEFGVEYEAIPELTMTCTDFNLMKEHYYLEDFEILDCLFFWTNNHLFNRYIDKWKEVKQNSTGARRTLAKLFLNSLYGKMAATTNSSFKVAYLKEDGSNGFYGVTAYDKQPGYIPVGSAITSYARCFTIRAAQQNYYGPDKPGFIYADTDSIHCDIAPEKIKGVKLDPKEFCCWKIENEWDYAIFTRAKTYIEHVVKEDGKSAEYYNVKCAGMPKRSKDYFIASITGNIPPIEDCTDDERIFFYDENGCPITRTLKDFNTGLNVPGKLLPVQIPGGVVLQETWFEMRDYSW